MKQQQSEEGKYSPQVEEILHRRPSLLVRKGILFLAILVVLALAASRFVKYPERLAAPATFMANPDSSGGKVVGEIILTEAAAGLVKRGMVVQADKRTSGQADKRTGGEIMGNYLFVGKVEELVPLGRGDYWRVVVSLESVSSEGMVSESGAKGIDSIALEPGTEGMAYIEIGETSLFENILNPVFAVFRTADR